LPEDTHRVSRVFRLFQAYHSHGVLPAAGGMAEQSATAMAAFHIAQVEVSDIEREQWEEHEREMKRQKLIADMEGRHRGR